jgi:zinc transport system substrate-binding protein
MNQQRAALVAIAVVIPLAMAATVYTGGRPPPQQQPQQQAGKDRLVVVASFYPLYDFASHVAGDRAEVSVLMPPGVEPHDWEPSAGDVARARNADLLIINGAGFEGWAAGVGAKRVVNTGEGIAELVSAGGGQQHPVDPHIWLDPVLAKRQVDAIKFALVQADPANAQYYSENAASYAKELDALDAFARKELSSCEKSDFIAFHDAFSRFAARYGLTQHAIQGITPEGEVLPQRLQEMIGLARQLGIDTIYSEEAVDSRLAQTIASEVPGGKVLVLSPIEGVSKGEQAAGVGYIEKMKENVANLREGLKCSNNNSSRG